MRAAGLWSVLSNSIVQLTHATALGRALLRIAAVVLPSGPIRGFDSLYNAPLELFPYSAEYNADDDDAPGADVDADTVRDSASASGADRRAAMAQAAAEVERKTREERQEKERKLQAFHEKLRTRVAAMQRAKHREERRKAKQQAAEAALRRERRMGRSAIGGDARVGAASVSSRSSGHHGAGRRGTAGARTPERRPRTSRSLVQSPAPTAVAMSGYADAGAALPSRPIDRQRVAVMLESQNARASLLAHAEAAAASGAASGAGSATGGGATFTGARDSGGAMAAVQSGVEGADDSDERDSDYGAGRTSGASSPLSWSWAHHQPDAHSATHGAGVAVRAQHAARATASMISAPRSVTARSVDSSPALSRGGPLDEVVAKRVSVRRAESSVERESAHDYARRLRAEAAAREEAAERAAAEEEERRAAHAAMHEHRARVAEQHRVEAAAKEAAAKAIQDAKVAQRRKAEEAQRFIDALRERAMERIRQRQVEIPPLCQCSPGLNPLAPHWDLCANNCVFYKNPEAYSRALADLFAALELV